MTTPPDTPLDLPADAPGRTARQFADVCRADLARRRRAGAGATAEEYLARFPTAFAAAEDALALIYGEYLAREEAGEAPDPAEYARRFPEHATALDLQFQLHAALAAESVPAAVAGPRPALPGLDLLDELGRGGAGVVYRARQARPGRVVAVKVLSAGEFAGPAAAGRFRAEAEAIARLQHPNIVQVFEVGEHGGRPYLVLEYVSGGSLADRLAAGPLPPREAAELAHTLAGAVEYAHGQGVVHRDLKPGNVLLESRERQRPEDSPAQDNTLVADAPGSPKIADFGLAKRSDATVNTATGDVLGTPSYMAPEQAAGEPVGPAADVYALGAILYECLTVRPPFRAATPLETLDQVRRRDPVPVRQLQPGVPRDLETVCLTCLRKEPGRRYPSAAALADDLRRFLDGRPVTARPVGTVERAWKWVWRRPAAAGLMGVSVAAAVALLAVWATFTADLKSERDAADLARRGAVTSAADADRQRDQAADSYRSARAALDEYRRLRDDPRIGGGGDLDDFRRELLKAEAGFYERFAAQKGDDARFRGEQAEAAYQLAIVQQLLGDDPAAEAAATRAMALYADLADKFPDEPVPAFGRVNTQQLRGNVRVRTSRPAEAEADLRAALALAEANDRRWPGVRDHRRTVAGVHHALGVLLRTGGRAADAVGHYRASIRVLDDLTGTAPADHDLAVDRVTFAISLAVAERSAGKGADAERTLRAALAAAAAFPPAVAADQRVRELTAGARAVLGATLLYLRRPADAAAELTPATDALRDVARRFPDRVYARRELAGALTELGQAHQDTGRAADAAKAYAEAVAVAGPLVRQTPGNRRHVQILGVAVGQHASMLKRDGRVTDALAVLADSVPVLEALAGQAPPGDVRASGLAAALTTRAACYLAVDRPADALADAERAAALRADWQRVEPLILRASALAKVGRHRDAADQLAALDRGKPRPDPFQTARLYSACAAAAQKDEGLTTDQRTAVAAGCLDRAAALLAEAEMGGRLALPGRAEQLRTGDDFAPLRERPETRALLDRLPTRP